MTEKSRIPVFLLKTKSSPKDGYDDLFNGPLASTYEHVFVPVLEHSFNSQSLASIQQKVASGAFNGSASRSEQYGGLVFTSQRAVEAFIQVIGRLRTANAELDKLLPENVPIYVVGPATARSLATIGLKCPILGEQSGNGDILAKFMLRDYNARHKLRIAPEEKPGLLFLVGEQRRDIIPKTLQSSERPMQERIEVEEITVYETGVMESFGRDFQDRLADVKLDVDRQWVVVFSPTGCRAMLEVLGMLDPSSRSIKAHTKHVARQTLIATIGPTTRDYLKRTFDFTPDAVAEKPSPEGVMAAIGGYAED